jgi:hypothetical protein
MRFSSWSQRREVVTQKVAQKVQKMMILSFLATVFRRHGYRWLKAESGPLMHLSEVFYGAVQSAIRGISRSPQKPMMERLPQRKQSNTGIFQTMEELVNESSAEFVAAALTSLNAGDEKQKGLSKLSPNTTQHLKNISLAIHE